MTKPAKPDYETGRVSTIHNTPHRIQRATIDAYQERAGEALIRFVVELTQAALDQDVPEDQRDLLFRTFAYDAAGALPPIARMMRVVHGVPAVLPAQLREILAEARGLYGQEPDADATLPMFEESTPAGPAVGLLLVSGKPPVGEKPTAADLRRLARAGKDFNAQSGGEPIADELMSRAAVALNMLQRQAYLLPSLDGLATAHSVAIIASNFADRPASTSHRAALFATDLDEVDRG